MAARLSAEEKVEIVRLYRDEHLSILQVSTKIGRSTNAVHCVLIAAGVPRRPAGWPKGCGRPRVPDAERAEIVRLYERERSMSRVAGLVGRSRSTVKRVVDEARVARVA